MPFCAKCGQQYDEGVRFCPSCGAPSEPPVQQEYQANAYQQQTTYQQAQPQANAAAGNKTMAILAVVFPVLFFLPLVAGDKTEFDKFWANQALLLFLLGILAGVTTAIIIGFLLYVVELVFWIMALIAVCNGQMKPLPIIGKIEIIK